MPSCAFVFTLASDSVSQFRATFEVKQDCQDGDETEVIVSTETKQRRPRRSVSILNTVCVLRRLLKCWLLLAAFGITICTFTVTGSQAGGEQTKKKNLTRGLMGLSISLMLTSRLPDMRLD